MSGKLKVDKVRLQRKQDGTYKLYVFSDSDKSGFAACTCDVHETSTEAEECQYAKELLVYLEIIPGDLK